MKKKILLLALISFLFSNIVTASTAQYNGYDIVTVQYEGKTIVPSDVPAVLMDGRTMVPLDYLRKAGFIVEWNDATQTANIKPKREQPSLTQEQLNKIAESVYEVFGSTDDPTKAIQGSAFVIGDTMITNAHVAGDSAYTQVMINGQWQKISSYAFVNKPNDVMGFKVTGAKPLPYSEQLPEIGDKVWAIGYPGGKLSITEGEVMDILQNEGKTLIQSSATTHGGSSGGILVNELGKIVGITSSALIIESANANYSIPISYALQELR